MRIAVAQVKASNTSNNLSNKISKIVFFLCLGQTKSLKRDVLKLNKYKDKMDAVFINSKNTKTSHFH